MKEKKSKQEKSKEIDFSKFEIIKEGQNLIKGGNMAPSPSSDPMQNGGNEPSACDALS
ncbi:MAG: hypothetical protein AB7V25_08865 [Mangrovibacterium sp.]